MGQIEIEIVKEGKDILITSTEGRQIKIPQSNNELKASETLEFLNYTEDKRYKLKDLDEELNADKNLVYVYEIFKSIIEKIDRNKRYLVKEIERLNNIDTEIQLLSQKIENIKKFNASNAIKSNIIVE